MHALGRLERSPGRLRWLRAPGRAGIRTDLVLEYWQGRLRDYPSSSKDTPASESDLASASGSFSSPVSRPMPAATEATTSPPVATDGLDTATTEFQKQHVFIATADMEAAAAAERKPPPKRRRKPQVRPRSHQNPPRPHKPGMVQDLLVKGCVLSTSRCNTWLNPAGLRTAGTRGCGPGGGGADDSQTRALAGAESGACAAQDRRVPNAECLLRVCFAAGSMGGEVEWAAAEAGSESVGATEMVQALLRTIRHDPPPRCFARYFE